MKDLSCKSKLYLCMSIKGHDKWIQYYETHKCSEFIKYEIVNFELIQRKNTKTEFHAFTVTV